MDAQQMSREPCVQTSMSRIPLLCFSHSTSSAPPLPSMADTAPESRSDGDEVLSSRHIAHGTFGAGKEHDPRVSFYRVRVVRLNYLETDIETLLQ